MEQEEGIKNINKIDIFYKIIGTGEPVVIVHGGPGLGHNYLYPHLTRLAEHYKVIFYDQRSSGKSSGHEKPSEITMESFIQDLEGLRKAFDIRKLNLLGHSWGGLLSLNYAVNYSDCLNALIIIGSSGASSGYVARFSKAIEDRLPPQKKEELTEIAESFINKEKTSVLFKKYYSLYFWAYFYDKSFADKISLDYIDDKMVQKYFICTHFLDEYLQDYSLFDRLNRITCPTLIVHGDYDPIPFQEAEKIHHGIKGSDFVLLQNCGHFAYMEKANACFEAVENFLDGHAERK